MIRGKAAATKVYENEHLVALMDIKPINQGHVLIVPKRHAELLTDLEDNIAGELMMAAKKIAIALRKSKLRVKAVNYFMADGAEAGQEVFHAHLHIIPRYRSDGFYLHMPSSYERETSRKELEDAASKIRAQL
jgi:histidine triad (HIT) family protein